MQTRRSPASRFAVASVLALLAAVGCGAEPTPPPVVVVVPPPQHPNLPFGAVKIAERGFSQAVEDGWQVAFDSSLTFLAVSDAPQSPPTIGVVTYRAGFIAGNEPINVFRVLPAAVETLYVSFWVKFSPGWVGHPASGVNKILHIFISGRNRVVFSATGSNASGLVPQLRLQEINSTSGVRNLDPNIVPLARIIRGLWHRWDIVLITNSAGNADGVAKWWLDGILVADHTDVPYVTAAQGHGWTSVNWAPTWGGVGGTVPAIQTQSLDNIFLAGK